MFLLAGGVGGVAIQVGRTRKRRWSSSLPWCSFGVVEAIISPVCKVVVGVQTGDALIGGMGMKPEMVSLVRSGEGDGWRWALRSRREEDMVGERESDVPAT